MREIDQRQGRFGLIRILERLSDGARLYCVGQGVQTMTLPDGTSLFGYIHAMKLMAGPIRSVLLLGGGGGSLATMLARKGAEVIVVDIDPQAEAIARDYFHLDPRVQWLTQDAASFVRFCTRRFDAVLIDACDADGVAEPFASFDWLVSAMSLLKPAGNLVVNLAGDGAPRPWTGRLVNNLRRQSFNAMLYVPACGEEANELLLVSRSRKAALQDRFSLADRPLETLEYLASLGPFASQA